MSPITAYIGLGSNLQAPIVQLESAIHALEKSDAVTHLNCSSFYATKPVGPQDQPDYVNAVAAIETTLDPLQLLDTLQKIELQQGRVREGVKRWGARTLDLDILLYGDEIIDEPRLKVPHVEIQNRAFVLYPLAEIAPGLLLPRLGPIQALLKAVDGNDISIINKNNNE